ncbi:S-adenosyl-L-methionine-dependent methyltransferase [Vararia minispora EC-137]|uniref:S-adenosyl-L-methionine-dependent methyltransferase n=1 Tax=Vararia minispora EC-137 TaxID=1314806 RepID=A0ACB8QVF8_9AGAM|nr:S-adenosyl-L-methionine-dependent methyltransferase [Vararia minispora EC-137]
MLRLALVRRSCLSHLARYRRLFHHTSRRAVTKPPEKRPPSRPPDKENYNYEIWADDAPDPRLVAFKRVTANDLEKCTKPPTEVKMLVRDFIEDSLYNPNYGYFPKQATIFTSEDTSIPFQEIHDMAHFEHEVAVRYSAYGKDGDGPGRQIWHTPTELFKPYYGHAIARCIVSEYLLKYFPYEDLVIYEIGAGNGTLARDILDFIREEYPEVYERTRYNIVEISRRLVQLQRQRLSVHYPIVSVTHKSIFHWDKTVASPCFFLAMEVIDNFAHDVIRYDYRTLEPYQGVVTIDEYNDFGMHYERIQDSLISSLLALRHRLNHQPIFPKLFRHSKLRSFILNFPLSPNLSPPEYIPTRLLSLLRTLRRYFPRHRLLLSDFSSLPDTIPGTNAPVVQTRFRNRTVPTETLLVQPGYFDIFFATDFERLRDMYEHILEQPVLHDDTTFGRVSPLGTSSSPLSEGANFFSSRRPRNRRVPLDGVPSSSGLPVGEHKSGVFGHAEFLETYSDLCKTRLRSGENPMLDFYKNVKFLF